MENVFSIQLWMKYSHGHYGLFGSFEIGRRTQLKSGKQWIGPIDVVPEKNGHLTWQIPLTGYALAPPNGVLLSPTRLEEVVLIDTGECI